MLCDCGRAELGFWVIRQFGNEIGYVKLEPGDLPGRHEEVLQKCAYCISERRRGTCYLPDTTNRSYGQAS